jgi:hypothetical protein
VDVIYQIDIEKNGMRVGSGPIISAISWSSEARLGEVGDFICRIAATDSQIPYVIPYNTLVCKVFIQTIGIVELARGEIRDIKTTIDPDGTPIIEVKGPDGLNRLTEKSVGYLEIGIVKRDTNGSTTSIGNPISLTAALDSIKEQLNKDNFNTAISQPGQLPWTFDYTGITGANNVTKMVFYQFAGETILAALAKICELAEVHFVVQPGNRVVFRRDDYFEDCGIRAIASPPEPDPLVKGTCYIVGTPTISEETRETFTRIIPWGYGRAETSVGLHHLADADEKNYIPKGSWPPLFPGHAWITEINAAGQEVPLGVSNTNAENSATVGAPGRIIEKFKKYQDVEPVLPDDFDAMKENGTDPVYDADTKKAIRARAYKSAAQTLLDTAQVELDEALNRTVHYDLSLLHLNHVVKPGQQIRCVFHYRLGTGWATVDQWLKITGVKLEVDSQGIRITDLTVSNVMQPPRLDADPLLQLYAWLNRFDGVTR